MRPASMRQFGHVEFNPEEMKLPRMIRIPASCFLESRVSLCFSRLACIEANDDECDCELRHGTMTFWAWQSYFPMRPSILMGDPCLNIRSL